MYFLFFFFDKKIFRWYKIIYPVWQLKRQYIFLVGQSYMVFDNPTYKYVSFLHQESVFNVLQFLPYVLFSMLMIVILWIENKIKLNKKTRNSTEWMYMKKKDVSGCCFKFRFPCILGYWIISFFLNNVNTCKYLHASVYT